MDSFDLKSFNLDEYAILFSNSFNQISPHLILFIHGLIISHFFRQGD